MMVFNLNTIVFYFHLIINRIATLFFTLLTMIPAIQKPNARMHVLIQHDVQFGHVLMLLHTSRTVQQVSVLVMSISICSTMNMIYGHHCLVRRSIDQCTGSWSKSCAELLSMSFSVTLQWQPSAASLCPTVDSIGCTKCHMRLASTPGYPAKYVTIV